MSNPNQTTPRDCNCTTCETWNRWNRGEDVSRREMNRAVMTGCTEADGWTDDSWQWNNR